MYKDHIMNNKKKTILCTNFVNNTKILNILFIQLQNSLIRNSSLSKYNYM